MEYVIQCRLSPQVNEALPIPIAGWPLFIFRFSVDDGPTIQEAGELFQAAAKELMQEAQNNLVLEYQSVETREGSITLIMFIAAVAAFPPAAVGVGTIGAGTLLVWAADKLLGGALSEFGKQLVRKTVTKFVGPEREPEIDHEDLEDVAQSHARQVAAERGCRLAIISGASPYDSRYAWTYELVGCDVKQVTVVVDPSGRVPTQTLVR